ncbi:MAG: diguanylate cyclase [Myxococcaceae bacterium]
MSLGLALAVSTPMQLDGNQVISLDGTWEGQLGDQGSGALQAVRVPGNLPFQGVKYDGVLWLRKHFTLPAVSQDFALRMPMTANAYEVFLNGQNLGGRGRIGATGELLEKDLRVQVYRLPKEALHAGDNELSIRLRTFYGNGGVQAPGVLIGPEPLVRDEQERRTTKVAMMVALFLFAGFFHVVLFAGRTRERHYLTFGLLSFSLASVTAGINTIGYLLTDNVDFNSYLVFVPLLVMPLCLVLFFSDFFARPAKRPKQVLQALAALSLVVLVSSTLHHPVYPFFEGVVLPLSVLALVSALLLSTWWAFVGLREGQLGARAILVGLAAYALTGVLELAWTFNLVNLHVDSYLGFAAFIGATVIAIASRFAWLHRQVELGERDPLTGCLTRHGFRARLSASGAELSAASCIMIDLDHFKAINDTHGHPMGDKVLRAAGEALRRALRGNDLVSRWGGEEFLIVLPADSTGGQEVAQRMQAALRSERVEALKITASFGIAARLPGEALEAWFARADRALYDAKEAGRDCIRTAAA